MSVFRILNFSGLPNPEYATDYSAGMDIRAHISADQVLNPGERVLIPTGLKIELPIGFEAQIRPRSGLALKQGLTVLNSPGTIDADYRGEVKILLINLGQEAVIIHPGDKIAQMVVSRHERVSWQEAEVLEESKRGEGGFGHTGI
jgi:dUTP pyrophosphatase